MATGHPIKFGTDGWRAVIGEDFTFGNVRLVAQATADFFARRHPNRTRKKIVVGYDRRFLSNEFAVTTAEVLAGNGFSVLLSNYPVPTPAVVDPPRKRIRTVESSFSRLIISESNLFLELFKNSSRKFS